MAWARHEAGITTELLLYNGVFGGNFSESMLSRLPYAYQCAYDPMH